MIAPRANPATNRHGLTFWGQWLCGITLVSGILCHLAIRQYGEVPVEYRLLVALTVLGSVPAYMLMRVYHKRYSYLPGLLHLAGGWATLLGGLGLLLWAGGSSSLFPATIMLEWALLGFVAQAVAFVPLRYFAMLHARKLNRERTAIIIGSSARAYELAERLHASNRVPLVGMVPATAGEQTRDGRFPVLGELPDLRGITEQHRVRRVYIAVTLEEMARIEQLYLGLLDMSVDVVWAPDFGRMPLVNQSIAQIDELPVIYLNEAPLSSHPAAVFSKGLIDRALALVALVALSPLLVATAIAVKLSSPGPVLFRQPRHGCNGEIIQILKFRSMRVHEDGEVRQATRDDDRVTRVGRFIRRTSIDELPQLINVLRGEMSMVGPRPHAVTHNHYYCDKIRAYMARHRIKPGITGLAQVTGHRGETETVEKMRQRVEQDLAYINNWSLWLDMKILVKTPLTLFSKNIY